MPIPVILPPVEPHFSPESAPKFLPVVAARSAFAGLKEAPLVGRALAYLIDMLVLCGISVYGAKILSLLLISGHMGEIYGSGKVASQVFQDTFFHAQMHLFFGLFACVAISYFVLMPRFAAGRTLGLGLVGLKIVGPDGHRPGFAAMWLRLLGCLLQFASGGLMYLQVLKGPSQPLLQDSLSRTRVIVHR